MNSEDQGVAANDEGKLSKCGNSMSDSDGKFFVKVLGTSLAEGKLVIISDQYD